ncbi:MAG: glycosyltransferase [Ornithinimicrobium sp.]
MMVSVVLVDPAGEHDPSPVLDALLAMADGFDTVFAPSAWLDRAEITTHRLFDSRGVGLQGLKELGVESAESTAEVGPGAGLSAALTRVCEDVEDDPENWLWVLTPAHVPTPGALPAMVAAARGSSRVAVVGPKLITAADRRIVAGVGHHVTAWGRSADFTRGGVFDQGQFDDTTDVIGVPITGMLIRRAVLTEIGGVQPVLDCAVAGLDLGWRAHLAGYRVVVAPDAVLTHDRMGAPALSGWDPAADPAQQRRASAHRVSLALARCSWWRLPARGLAMALSSLMMALLWALARRPRATALALTEAMAVGAVGRMVRARRSGGPRVVREGDLRGLFTRLRGASARARFLRLDTPVEARGAAERPSEAERSVQAIESGPVSDEASSLDDSQPAARRRWWVWPAALVAVAVAASVAGWRGLGVAGLSAQGWGVRGPEVLTVSASASSMWADWAAGWSGTGLGQAGQGPIWLVPLAAWTWLMEHVVAGPDPGNSAAVGTAWLLLAAIPLSTLSAYFACRRALPSRVARAILALGWGGLAPLVGALDEGRVGPGLVHMLAPLLVAGVMSSVRPGRRGTSAACGTTVLIAAAAAFVPIVLSVGIVGGLLVAIAAPGWCRLRGMLLALGPVGLLGPAAVGLLADPVLVLGGAGATVSAAPQIGVASALMLYPGGPVSLALWWLLPAWLLVAVAILDPGRTAAGRSATTLTLVALLGIAASIAASRTVIGQMPQGFPDAGAEVSPWPGTLLSLAGATLLLAVAIGVRSALATQGSFAADGRAPILAAASLSVVLVVGAAGAAGTMALHGIQGVGSGLTVADPPVPAVVTERTEGPERVRLITLQPQPAPQRSGGYLIGYDITSAEPRPWLRDRARDVVRHAAADPQPALLGRALRGLADDTDDAVINPEPLEEAMADLAVGYVAVQTDPGHPVVEQLDRLPSLIRVNSTPGQELWRVRPEAAGSRAWWQDQDGDRVELAPVNGAHASLQASVPPNARYLAVAQPQEWERAARVTVDGQVVVPTQGAYPRFAVPRDADSVRIELPTPHARWWWASLIAVALLLAFSVPILLPRRRS